MPWHWVEDPLLGVLPDEQLDELLRKVLARGLSGLEPGVIERLAKAPMTLALLRGLIDEEWPDYWRIRADRDAEDDPPHESWTLDLNFRTYRAAIPDG